MHDLIQRSLLDSFSLALIHSFINVSLTTLSGRVRNKPGKWVVMLMCYGVSIFFIEF
jgi:hypothetical protein